MYLDTVEKMIAHFGVGRCVQAREDYEDSVHNSLSWFFVADYCKLNKLSPFDSYNYNRTKELFKKLIKEI